MQILKYINAKHFFPKYAPHVKNWSHKLRGKSGRGKPLTFDDRDKFNIACGVLILFQDMKKDYQTTDGEDWKHEILPGTFEKRGLPGHDYKPKNK